MKRVAIVISSQYGQTLKIAECLRSVLEEFDEYVRLFIVTNESELSQVRLDQFDAFIVGGPVYVGSLPVPLQRWTKTHAEWLNEVPVGFFTVSLNAADKRPEARSEDTRIINEFLEHTGLDPDLSASFIGAIHYRKYGFFEKWILRRISRTAGGPTDTSVNHELTNWNAVKSFAQSFADIVSDQQPRTPVPQLD